MKKKEGYPLFSLYFLIGGSLSKIHLQRLLGLSNLFQVAEVLSGPRKGHKLSLVPSVVEKYIEHIHMIGLL